MASDFLFNIELYFSLYTTETSISIIGEEAHHLMKVMRHSVGDEIFTTNGNGKIFRVEISSTEKNEVKGKIKETFSYENRLSNFSICIPRLRVADRFEFALEKCVELGFTNIVVYESERTLARGDKSDRWQKIAVAAMKQSLQSYLPKVTFLNKVNKLKDLEGIKITFDQNSEKHFSDVIKSFKKDEKYNLIFGPEGGLTHDEIELLGKSNIYKLTQNRLRTETAIISAASILSLTF